MTNMTTTVIIPTMLTNGVLYATLTGLDNGTLTPNNVVLAVDAKSYSEKTVASLRDWVEANMNNISPIIVPSSVTGAGAVRNFGVTLALELLDQDLIVFIGDDCIPDEGMLFGHVVRHFLEGTNEPLITQGYSPHSPEVLSTPFMVFVDQSGVTANWSAILDKKTTDDISGFLLTTNVGFSMSAIDVLLDKDGNIFPEYPNAAWEDIATGRRAQSYGVKTVFVRDSVVHHYHEHDPITFVRRQLSEGHNRINFCTDFPQTANAMLPVKSIQNALDTLSDVDVSAMITIMNGFNTYPFPQTDSVVEMQQGVFSSVMQIASIRGAATHIANILQADELSFLQVYPYLTQDGATMLVFAAIKALMDEDWEYLEHCAHWIYQHEGDTFASAFFAGLVNIHLKKYLEAHTELVKAMALNNHQLVGKLLRNVTELLDDVGRDV